MNGIGEREERTNVHWFRSCPRAVGTVGLTTWIGTRAHMTNKCAPVEEALGSTQDLYEVVDWEVRTRLDRLAAAVHSGLRRSSRWLLITVAMPCLLPNSGLRRTHRSSARRSGC
ncbi:hypothetical protein HLASF_0515 [Halanaeroarchaeum sulfurireducens]|uniref:Uncharacterized protein n=1 Tax=Halanaeroarchaeum sulfurireducens TaxID=1604004 RepID=A0A0F7PBJ1_9EURY|nr:hypothetical protein HLASF_0515 [Halanaeroarchaeum sulfurireducens]ALG81415.1 hypothetical protein HLASA_0512 [Halanaeroarchaeum sulfurireducens]